ncbi:MAG TPA: PAS domain S-box protein [Steroidobacteraceae bacterium]
MDSAFEYARGPERLPAIPDDARWSMFLYRNLAWMAPGFVFEYRIDAQGKPEAVWASEGVEAVMGCTLQEVERRGGWDALLDDAWRPVAHARQERLLQGEAQSGELHIRSTTGDRKWLEINLQPVLDSGSGNVTGIVGSAYDITTRKVAEDALLKSEAVLRAVTENTPDWLFLLDEKLHVRFMNRPFGPNRPETVMGLHFLDFIPQDLRPGMEEIYGKALTSGTPARLELRKPGPDGSLGNFEHRIMPVIEGGVVRSLTVAVTDVTERKRVESELRTQVRILETMQEGVVLVDPNSHAIRLTNPTFDRMFGYATTELLGRSIEPLFSMLTVQRRRLARALRDGSRTGEIVPVEFECARKDGTRFVAACVVTPLNMNGSEHWLAVLNDVTERKQLEREIIEIANREQQRIGSDLHDGLGQELTGIALMLKGVVSQLRKEGSTSAGDVEEVIGLVNSAIDSTRTLARGLSPVGSGRGDLGAAIQTLGTRIGERFGVRVVCELDFAEPLRLSETAAAHVYRVVQEALTNVVRHSDAREVTIRLRTSDNELHLQVDDDGKGFARTPMDRAGGLGLKIMRYRAQMLGGDLVIESTPSGGTSVRCSCPLDLTVGVDRDDDTT